MAAPVGTSGRPAAKARVAEDSSVLLCDDPARMDFALDAAKMGNSYDASRALRGDHFFRVNGPASLAVRQSDMKSRWPKLLVTVEDGDTEGKTGWVLASEVQQAR